MTHTVPPEDAKVKILIAGCILMFSLVIIFGFSLLTACSALPQFFQAADDVLTDDAITVQVDKEAFQKDTDVNVYVEIKNKESK